MHAFCSIKEINRLISKGISNIYLKVILKKKGRSKNFCFSEFKKILLQLIEF